MEKDLKEIKRLKDESKLDYKIRILTLKKNYVLEQKKVKEYRAAIKEYGKLISAKVTEIKNAETKE
jgi:low affinity Fe/Cu permease